MGNLLIDSNDGTLRRIPDEPQLRGCHPSVSPDGTLFVMDGLLDTLGGKPGEWGVVVGDLRGRHYAIVHRFDNTHGARSWRRSDPHPVFSADGRRIYFNVSSGDWTQLHVAEAGSEVPDSVGARPPSHSRRSAWSRIDRPELGQGPSSISRVPRRERGIEGEGPAKVVACFHRIMQAVIDHPRMEKESGVPGAELQRLGHGFGRLLGVVRS